MTDTVAQEAPAVDQSAAEEAALAAEFGDENVTPAPVAQETAAESVPENADQEPAQPETTDDAVQTESETNTEEHDPFATLKEQAPVEDIKPQHEIDASKLAARFDNLSDEQQAQKLKNLSANRPQTFNALCNELGEDPQEILAIINSDENKSQDVDKNQLKAEIREEIKQEQGEAMNLVQKQAEGARFVAEIQRFGTNNGLAADQIQALSQYGGDVQKSFESMKYDPATGAPLTFNKRLELTLRNSEEVSGMLMNTQATQKAKKMTAAAQTRIIEGGGSADQDLYNLDDAAFLAQTNSASHANQDWAPQ